MADLKSINSVAAASLKSFNGVAAASLKSIAGLSVDSGQYEAAKEQMIIDIQSHCSNPNKIVGLWFFDQHGSSTTLTDRSGKNMNGNLSAIGSTLNPGFAGMCPYVNLTNGAYWRRNDSDYYSFGNASTDTPFTFIALVNPNSMDNGNIIAKYKYVYSEGDREYRFYFYNNGLRIILIDPQGLGVPSLYNRSTDISNDIGSWHVYIATYNGSSNASGLKLYRDGTLLSGSSGMDPGGYGGTYVAMHNTPIEIGSFEFSGTTRVNFGDFKAGLIGIIREAFSAGSVESISAALLAYAGVSA